MREEMLLESVNVGAIDVIHHDTRSFRTGICKQPVAGPLEVTEAGVVGDAIVNTEHHGGVDQALYAYSTVDYEWWRETTWLDWAPGLFGENLTIRELPTDLNIGDRLLIREVVLEVTAPRIPCSTFAARMHDSGFGLAFRRAERPGAYLRVLSGGEISAGDSVTHLVNDDSGVSILDLFRFNYASSHDIDELRRYLLAPLAIRMRQKVEQRLNAAERRLG